jgi:hypothetical protein
LLPQFVELIPNWNWLENRRKIPMKHYGCHFSLLLPDSTDHQQSDAEEPGKNSDEALLPSKLSGVVAGTRWIRSIYMTVNCSITLIL